MLKTVYLPKYNMYLVRLTDVFEEKVIFYDTFINC